jgi:hypothetical protein
MSNHGDNDDATNGAADGNPGAKGATNGGSPGADPGAEIVGDVVAVFLIDLAAVDGGAMEGLRERTGRAGELLRQYGRDRTLAYREELRRARRLVDKLYEVVEADLPPEEAP